MTAATMATTFSDEGRMGDAFSHYYNGTWVMTAKKMTALTMTATCNSRRLLSPPWQQHVSYDCSKERSACTMTVTFKLPLLQEGPSATMPILTSRSGTRSGALWTQKLRSSLLRTQSYQRFSFISWRRLNYSFACSGHWQELCRLISDSSNFCLFDSFDFISPNPMSSESAMWHEQ